MENITTLYPISEVTFLYNTSSNIPDYYDYEDEYYEKSHIYYFTLVVFSLDILLGTTVNGLVLFFTTFKMKKTVNVIWLLNLSLADFTFTLFLPLSIIYLVNNFNWTFGNFMCKLNTMVAFINLFASVFLLTVISIDRCISVIFPVWCQNHRTPRLALFVVMGVWILAIMFSLPYFIFRDTFEDIDGTICYNNFNRGESEDIGISRHRGTVIMRSIVGFFIPFTIIVTCYSVIALRIQKKRKTTSRKPFKVIIAVLISFFICYAPYQIFTFLELHSLSRNDDYLHNILLVGIPLASNLAFLKKCVNPFLYAFISQDFRNTFWKSVNSLFKKGLYA
ncbi:chemerin-like receptor 1 [Eleutherodactylus coqui]|uniref:chemerin-like receptor 1 n=1 Tax=Eleutherodactylus coqui TaxID=57060 RepID=UPI003461F07D